MSGGQILCLAVVALLVFGSVMTAWANAWAKRGGGRSTNDISDADTGEIFRHPDDGPL